MTKEPRQLVCCFRHKEYFDFQFRNATIQLVACSASPSPPAAHLQQLLCRQEPDEEDAHGCRPGDFQCFYGGDDGGQLVIVVVMKVMDPCEEGQMAVVQVGHLVMIVIMVLIM